MPFQLPEQWVLQPALPVMQVLAIAAALLALAVVAYARTARHRPLAATMLGIMRVTVILLLTALLMGPSVVPDADEQPHRPTLGILVDTSASMQRDDADRDGRTRWDAITQHWLNDQQLADLNEHFDVRLLGFARDAAAISPDLLNQPAEQAATGGVTRYADSLATAMLDLDRAARRSHAELIVLGDGHDSDDASLASPAAFARDRGIHVHSVAVGAPDAPPNVAVVALPRQDFLLLEEEGQIIVQVHQGGLDQESVTLHIESESHGRIERTIDFAGRGSATIDLPVQHDEPGLHAYDVWVDPLPGEVATDDNRHRAFIEVLDRGMRVLILEGEPYWDTKFLAQSLRRDVRMEITQITQLSTERREGIVTRTGAQATVPTNIEEFAEYDVIILGRHIDALLDAEGLAAMRDWVLDEGGQLVFARGRPYTPNSNTGREAGEILGTIEPVTWHADLVRHVPISLTAAGRSNPVFSMAGLTADLDEAFASLPPLRVVYAVDSVKPASIVLARIGRGRRVGQAADAELATAPAIVEMNVGSGRVLALLGEGFWQWRLLPPGLAQYEGVFDAFWSNAVRYLAAGGDFRPGEDASLQLGRSIVQAGDPLTIDVALRHAPPENFDPVIQLTGPDGQTQSVHPTLRPGMRNRYRATIHPEQPGVWQASLEVDPPLQPEQQQRPFSVYQLDFERIRSSARPDVLRDLASRTGGLFFDAAEPVNLADQLQRRLASQRIPPSPSYMWDNGLILFLLVVWLGLEWIGRRRHGWL